jgi:hypothetical protein
MKYKAPKQPTGIDLLIDICNHPRKYDRVVNVPAHADAAQYLLESGYSLNPKQLPLFMAKNRELFPSRMLSIATQATRELNMN